MVRPLGYFAGFAGLLHDQVVILGLYHAFELGMLVAGANEEEPRLLAHPLVDLKVYGELLGAAVVGAFAHEDRLRHGGAVALLEPRNVLVDLAEQRLVTRSPLLPQ